MKILFYLSRFPGWGGIETVTETVGNKLADLGHQISILSHVSQDRPSALLKRAPLYQLPEQPFFNDRGEYIWDTEKNRQFALELSRKERFDLIIFQDSYAPCEHIVLAMAKECGARLIVFEHSTPLYSRKVVSRPGFRHFRKRRRFNKNIRNDDQRHALLLNEADAYVVLSDSYRKELQKVCSLNNKSSLRDKIFTIHNPLTVPDYPVDFQKKENVILFVGQITEDKRVDLMVRVWERLFRQFPDWKLQIVGDGPLAPALRERCKKRGIERVEFCGLQQPGPYYERAKLFWMTSSFEGWPMTVTESMSRGCVPLVMDSFSSIGEILQDGRNGYILPDKSVKAFARASGELMKDEELRQKMAVKAVAKADTLDINRIIPHWIDLIEDRQRQRKRFLLLAPELDGNAAAFVLRNLALALSHLADLDIVTPYFGNEPAPENVRVIYSGHSRHFNWKEVDRNWRRYHCDPPDLWWYFRVRPRIWKHIWGRKYDAVLSFSSAISLPVLMLGRHFSRWLKLPWYIYSVDGIPSPKEWMEGFEGSHDRIARFVDRICRSARIFYLSNFRMAEYEKRICTHFHGRFDWLYTTPRSQKDYPKRPHDILTLLYTGALYGKRSVRGLKDALSALHEKGKDIKAVFVGDIAPAFAGELEELVQKGVVALHPFQNELDAFYEEADILLDLGGDSDHDIFLSSKIISYLPIDRPILAVSGIPSPARDVMKDCPSIIHCRNIGAEIEEGILQCEAMVGKGIEDRRPLLEQFRPETMALKLFNDICR